ncbi:MAG: PAS domain S-box protein, partial [Candidatus Heimdallarchaeota archaeon]
KVYEQLILTKNTHSQSLLTLSIELEESQSYSQICEAALKSIRTATKYNGLVAYLISGDQNKLISIFNKRSNGKKSQSVNSELPIKNDEFLSECIATNKITIVEDARIDPRTNKAIVNSLENVSIVSIPIMLKSKTIGLFFTGTWSQEDVIVPDELEFNFLYAMSKNIGIALDRLFLENKRQEAVNELSSSQEMLKLVLNTIPQAVVWKDKESNFLGCNKAFLDLVGEKKSQNIIGKSDYNLKVTREEAAKYQEDDSQVMNTNTPKLNFEESITMPDSSINWLLTNKIPLHDAIGNVTGVLTTIENITKRKKNEQTLLLNKKIIEAIPSHISVVDSNYNYKYVNDVYSKVHGLPIEKLLSMNVPELLGQEIFDKLAKPNLDRCLKGEEIHYESWFTFNINVKRYMTVSYLPLKTDDKINDIVVISNDITALKLAEEDLKISEDRLSKVMLAANDGMWDWNLETNEIFFDSRYYEMAGYKKNEFPPTLEEFQKRVHPDYINYVMDSVDDYLKDKTSNFRAEFLFAKKDGSWMWIMGRGVIVERNENGKAIRFIGTHTDINKRKLAEQALANSEKYYRALIENSSDVISILDEKGFVKYESPSHERILGYPAGELINRNIFKHVHPDDIERISLQFKDLLQRPGDNEPVSFRFFHKEKKWIYLEGSGKNLLLSPYVKGIIVNYRDVTKRKLAEADHNRLVHAIEQSKDTVIITDSEGLIQYVNPAFESTSGYSLEEVIGKDTNFLRSGKLENEFFDEMWTTLGQGKIWAGRFTNKKKDNTLYIEDVTISPVLDDSGKIINFVSVQRDVTEKLKLEEQFQQAQKVESIGRLAGGIAHDLNNLLTPIIGFSELLLYDFEPNDDRKKSIQQILGAGHRAKDLVHQLLAFSRKQTLEYKPIDINKTIESFIGLLHRTIREDVKIEFYPAPKIPLFMADKGQIEQVIMNLAVNAQDAMPDGGLLTIETDLIEINENQISLHGDVIPGTYTMIAISDTGCGMDEETKTQIFEPFFTTKGLSGTGLGLATVYGIVKQHNGTITLYSELSKGTSFNIYLPVLEELAHESKTEKISPTNLQGTETIILVEDDEHVRFLAHAILKQQGYTVLIASNGLEALSIFEKNDTFIHLLLTDVVMPEINGRKLYEKAVKIHSHLKVLYMSGYNENIIAHQGVLNQGVAFIQKPFSVLHLAKRIREVLDN